MMKKIISVIISAVVMAAGTVSVFANDEEAKGNFESFYAKTVVEVLAENYKFGISKGEIYENVMDYVLTEHPELLEGVLEAAADSMDEHTFYLGEEELGSFYNYIDNGYVGIGVTVERAKNGIRISDVNMNGPAKEAGFKVGDIIICVEGEDVTGLDVASVSEKIRGPEGTAVNVTLLRDENEIELTVERRTVNISSVSYELNTEKNIGYVYISNFNSETPEGVREALTAFKYQDIKSVILDLRDNPGGELSAAVDVLSMFVPKGKLLITTVNAKGREYKIYSKSATNLLKYKLVVLVNENSASAAELFAGAVRDNNAGTIIGKTTYGKGTVQTMMGLKNPEGHTIGDIKLTTAEYLLPSGEHVNGVGVTPNIVVKNEEKKLDDGSFTELIFAPKYSVGDKGEGVLAVKERLNALGYFVGEVNDEYDDETAVAVSTFQQQAKLYPYGVMDITTQNYLNNIFSEAKEVVDRQLEAAYDYFESGK